MKKKIIFVLLLMVSILTITGCGSEEEKDNKNTSSLDKELSLEKIQFKYSSNGNLKETETSKRIEFDDYSIIVSIQEDKNIKTLVDEKGLVFNSTKEINKTKWQVYDFKSSSVESIIYMQEVGNDTYNVTFVHDANSKNDLSNIINEFMENVSFK